MDNTFRGKIFSTLLILIAVFLVGLVVYRYGFRMGYLNKANDIEDANIKKAKKNIDVEELHVDSLKYQQVKLDSSIVSVKKTNTVKSKSLPKIMARVKKDTVSFSREAVKVIDTIHSIVIVKDSLIKLQDSTIFNQRGIIKSKDNIIGYKNDIIQGYVNKEANSRYSSKSKRFSLNISVGYGVGVKNNTVSYTPYVGVGVGYNIFSF